MKYKVIEIEDFTDYAYLDSSTSLMGYQLSLKVETHYKNEKKRWELEFQSDEFPAFTDSYGMSSYVGADNNEYDAFERYVCNAETPKILEEIQNIVEEEARKFRKHLLLEAKELKKLQQLEKNLESVSEEVLKKNSLLAVQTIRKIKEQVKKVTELLGA